ncbi:hypothetical protein ACE6H2_020849 [Prunus campanulata]
MKEEISKLKVKLEEAQVQAVMYNELRYNVEEVVADAHKQYDELSNDLQQLLEFIQKEKRVKSKESTPDLKTWVIRLKQKHRKPKRLHGYGYDEIKILREPRKAKVDAHGHVVVSTEKNKPCKEASNVSTLIVHSDESKGKQQLGTTIVGHKDVGGKRQISATIDPSCMFVWIYLSNEEQDKLHHFLICTDSGVPLWQGLYSAMYKDDLKDLLTEAAVTCNRDVVTTFLQFNSCIAANVLNNGHRMRLSEKDGRKAIQSPLTHGEKKTLQWLKSTDSNDPLWQSTTCPRQLDDS